VKSKPCIFQLFGIPPKVAVRVKVSTVMATTTERGKVVWGLPLVLARLVTQVVQLQEDLLSAVFTVATSSPVDSVARLR
jgi:hypothetical protein